MDSETERIIKELQKEDIISGDRWGFFVSRGIREVSELWRARTGSDGGFEGSLKREETTDGIEKVIFALADAFRTAPERVIRPDWAEDAYLVTVGGSPENGASSGLWKFDPSAGEDGSYRRMDNPEIIVTRNMAWRSWGPSASGQTRAFGVSDLSIVGFLDHISE